MYVTQVTIKLATQVFSVNFNMILRTIQRPSLVVYLQPRRFFKTTTSGLLSQPPNPTSEYERPSPPRLPKHLQEEFEKLQKQAESNSTGNIGPDGQELHPDVRQPVPAEFTGDRNPSTGEIGGPKTEPTKHGDWSFRGRTSDF